VEVLNETEVGEHDMPLAREEDVCRFDVAMDDPAGVKEAEGNNLVVEYCE
jgi:hypothetical protein